MNHKVTGVIFMLLASGYIGESAHELYYNVLALDYKTMWSVLRLLLGIASCIYGYKRYTFKPQKGEGDQVS